MIKVIYIEAAFPYGKSGIAPLGKEYGVLFKGSYLRNNIVPKPDKRLFRGSSLNKTAGKVDAEAVEAEIYPLL